MLIWLVERWKKLMQPCWNFLNMISMNSASFLILGWINVVFWKWPSFTEFVIMLKSAHNLDFMVNHLDNLVDLLLKWTKKRWVNQVVTVTSTETKTNYSGFGWTRIHMKWLLNTWTNMVIRARFFPLHGSAQIWLELLRTLQSFASYPTR